MGASPVTNDDDPVPLGLVLGLEEAFRVLEALEDALLELERAGAAPGLRDELATVIAAVGSDPTKETADG